MKVVHQGSKGYEVAYLQRLLNKSLDLDGVYATQLGVDGSFGAITAAALRDFQSRHKLKVTGTTDGATWEALGLQMEKLHTNIRLMAQSNATSCWSVAASMILGNRSVGPGDADLKWTGELHPSLLNVQKFADSLGWEMLNYSPTVPMLAGIVQRTPVWLMGGGATWAHAIAVTGVFTDWDESGDGTMFRIHDPWPVNVGKVYGSFGNPIRIFDGSGVTRTDVRLDCVLVPH